MTDAIFDDIVSGFYRAASGAIGWVEALAPFQRAFSAIAVYLHGVDLTQGRLAFAHTANDMPVEAELDYLRTYHRIDPRTSLVLDRPPGEWVNCWEVFDDAFVARDPFYQDFLIPYGGRYVSGVKLLQDESLCVFIGVHRGVGSPKLDTNEIATCQRLAGHLTGALTMYREQMRMHRERRLGFGVLARIRAPVVLIDDRRHVHQTNPAARALLASNDAVFERDGHLYCRRPADDAVLLRGLQDLLSRNGTADPNDTVDNTLFVRAHASASDSGVGLYLDALRPEKTLHVFGEQPLAMVTLHDLRSRLKIDPFIVATAFELTPAEAKVAVAIAEGASPEEVAKRHRTSIHTVRSQIQTILQKTATTRQAELVGLLASLTPFGPAR